MFRYIASLFLVLGQAHGVLADEPPQRLTICTWNVEWFFDDHTGDNFADLAKQQAAPSREEWDWKLAKVAEVLGKLRPTIVALQEVENRRVLFYLTSKLRREHDLNYRVAYIEGEDFFTEQDVAILAQSGLERYSRRERLGQELEREDFQSLTKHLFADFAWGQGEQRVELTLLNLHTRATPQGAELRQKQARLARHWLRQEIDAGRHVVILGDLNAEEPAQAAAPLSEIGIFRGLDTPTTADDLADVLLSLRDEPRGTHLTGKQYDRILFRAPLAGGEGQPALVLRSVAIRRDLVIRGKEQDREHFNVFWKIPQAERDISDHYPLVAEFELR
jgi:endonuclease/exonuclease/phosphatase family metal-dependent hydrolase